MTIGDFGAKILEKVVYNQLYKYLNENELLLNHQSGFRSLHSTSRPIVQEICSFLAMLIDTIINCN